METLTSQSIKDKFEIASKDKSLFRNCAGFVSYLIGFDETETMVNTDELVKRLTFVNEIDFSKVDYNNYKDLAQISDVVAVKVNYPGISNPKNLEEMVNNYRKGKNYIHLAAIDKENLEYIFERPDIEKTPQREKWDTLMKLNDEIYSDIKLVFYRK